MISHATGSKALSVLILVVAALSRLFGDEIDAGRADFERARPGVDGRELEKVAFITINSGRWPGDALQWVFSRDSDNMGVSRGSY